ncbi:MAG: IS630 family transposase [Candidatus Methylumidiphilus sp.]
MIALVFSKKVLEELHAAISLALATKNIMSYRLATALIMVSDGHKIDEIAIMLGVCGKTVFNWVVKFISGGTAWVTGKHYEGRGRKAKLTDVQKKELYDMIIEGPEKHGFSSSLWNCAMIAHLIILKFSIQFNLNYLPSLLKKIGISYQKARFISDRQDEEEYESARKVWQQKTLPALIKKAKEENGVVLFGDEVSFAMWGSLSRTWAPIGKQPIVKTRGIRKGLKMFGVIGLECGSFRYQQLLGYSLQPKSLKLIKDAGLPKELLAQLKALKGEEYRTATEFINALKISLGEQLASEYQDMILKFTETAGKFNGITYIEFLKHLLESYDGKIFLIEDGAPYHHSKIVAEFKLANKERLTVTPLPAYSPEFNPIEKLWKNTKREATHLKYFKTFEELHNSVVKTFKSYMQDASKVICVMEKMRKTFGMAA